MKSESKKYLPVVLDISNKKIMIIGGGRIALQKLLALLPFTDNITILSKEICEKIRQTCYTQIIKEYHPGDLQHYSIVYACTNNREVNAQIKTHASKLGILVNVVDDPSLCDFISPAVFKKDYLTIAVSSNGVNVKKAIEWRNKIKHLIENDTDEKN
ncbi:MAG: bifunctional precorrin-2 dehydrogenase/sirohydrochlorin ferrochelatase [Bacteroidales bacterium]|nr:bifunctional precorrin-2 dehydrogenase/sirohydrochlorin ferrochelatase [Bacteroidales bacterium]